MVSKRKRPDTDDVLRASCYLQGKNSLQDAHLTLLPDNTVRVLVHEGGIASRDSVVSVRQAKRLRDSLLEKKWKVVSRPRRTEEQLRSNIEAACREFLSRRTRMRREPDPDENLVPPARQMQLQRERLSLPSAATTRGARVLQGGSFETNKRRH
jgi:hypothetical protein